MGLITGIYFVLAINNLAFSRNNYFCNNTQNKENRISFLTCEYKEINK